MSNLLHHNIVIFSNKVKCQIAPTVKRKLKLTVILYGDSHPKGLEIGQISAHDQDKANCLVIMGTSLRIPGVKALIKDFAKAVHECKRLYDI
ncbi:2684_t:CDS:2, partial [Dentiscutata heterogama]